MVVETVWIVTLISSQIAGLLAGCYLGHRFRTKPGLDPVDEGPLIVSRPRPVGPYRTAGALDPVAMCEACGDEPPDQYSPVEAGLCLDCFVEDGLRT